MTRFFVVLTFVFLSASVAQAQVFFEMSEDKAQVPGEGSGGFGASLMFDWQAKFKLGQLMREPVVSMQFRYRVLGGVVTLPTHDPEAEDGFQTEKLDGLPLEAQSLPELYDVKIRMYFIGKNGIKGMMLVDVGAPRKEGNWSFNVPGSPSWDKLFRSWNDDGWLSADRAKAMLGSGLMLDRYELDRAHLSLFDLHMWYEKNNPREWLRAYRNANRRVKQGINVSYGFSFSDQTNSFEIKPSDMSVGRAIKELEAERKQYYKLIDIPDPFRLVRNDAPYQQSIKDARLMLRAAGRTLPKVTTDQLNVAAARKAGYAPEFGRSQSERQKKTTPVNVATRKPSCHINLLIQCGQGQKSALTYPDQTIDAYPCGLSKSARQYFFMWDGKWSSVVERHQDYGTAKFDSFLRKYEKVLDRFENVVRQRFPECQVGKGREVGVFQPGKKSLALPRSDYFYVEGFRP